MQRNPHIWLKSIFSVAAANSYNLKYAIAYSIHKKIPTFNNCDCQMAMTFLKIPSLG
jgi:hypothetical protein